MSIQARIIAAAILLMTVLGITPSALAHGAIAVGTSGNFAKDGFAFGGSVREPTKEAAIDQALKTCRKFTGAPKMAKICRIVATFKDECFALSFDPKVGTRGFGWAIGPDKETAGERAQAACETAAEPNRRKFCQITQSYCDTQKDAIAPAATPQVAPQVQPRVLSISPLASLPIDAEAKILVPDYASEFPNGGGGRALSIPRRGKFTIDFSIPDGRKLRITVAHISENEKTLGQEVLKKEISGVSSESVTLERGKYYVHFGCEDVSDCRLTWRASMLDD